MQIRRAWAMPDSCTFKIKPIQQLVGRYLEWGGVWIDPFVRSSPFKHLMHATNDLDPSVDADYHQDALDFLKLHKGGVVDGVLFDPPYSPRQIKECYDGIGYSVTTEDTQSSKWSAWKDAEADSIRLGGTCISFGWNSGGLGTKRGFDIHEILLVAHGGMHNDTIVVVERKEREQMKLF